VADESVVAAPDELDTSRDVPGDAESGDTDSASIDIEDSAVPAASGASDEPARPYFMIPCTPAGIPKHTVLTHQNAPPVSTGG
jgi:hypothetical protein